MAASIKLISLNIERSKHLDRVLPFLEQEKPDVVCLQEVLERDVERIETAAGTCHAYAPICWHPADSPEVGAVLTGTAFFTRLKTENVRIDYYHGDESHARTAPPRTIMEDISLISADVTKDGRLFRLMTTHFTWTPHGQPDEHQRRDVDALIGLLDTAGEFVLAGDFNAPRGGEIFSKLALRFKDNIPGSYATSLDLTLHRAAKEHADELKDKMVDGLFTTPEYRAENVRLEFGLSDHAAIVADIFRA